MIWDIELSNALLLCTLYTLVLIVSCYAFPTSIRQLDYDDPRQVKARMVSTSLASALTVLSLALLPQEKCGPSFGEYLGFRAEGLLLAIVVPFALVELFFFGNLVMLLLKYFRQRRLSLSKDIVVEDSMSNSATFADGDIANRSHRFSIGNTSTRSLSSVESRTGVMNFRDYFIAPLTEELIFRCAMVPLLLSSGSGEEFVLFVAPVFFSLCHLHLCYGDVRELKDSDFRKEDTFAILNDYSLRVAYTYIFGLFVTALFIRTGHFVTILIAHMLCNMNGLPDITFLSDKSPFFKFRLIILGVYIFGFVSFGFAFLPLTDPEYFSSPFVEFRGCENTTG